MVKQQSALLDATFAALADPTRRAILARLTLGTSTVTEVAQPFAMSLPAVSKHLKVLEQAGLVARRRLGRTHHLSVRLEPLRRAASWIEDQRRFWEQSLDRLARHLDDLEEENRHDHKGRDQERE